MYSKEHIESMKKKYPDVDICTGRNCQLTEQEHELFYIYEQAEANDAKDGKVRTYYKTNGKGDVEELHMKHDGTKWVRID